MTIEQRRLRRHHGVTDDPADQVFGMYCTLLPGSQSRSRESFFTPTHNRTHRAIGGSNRSVCPLEKTVKRPTTCACRSIESSDWAWERFSYRSVRPTRGECGFSVRPTRLRTIAYLGQGEAKHTPSHTHSFDAVCVVPGGGGRLRCDRVV